jgi:hypothetical protein
MNCHQILRHPQIDRVETHGRHGSKGLPFIAVAHGYERVPERNGDSPVIGIFEHPGQSAIFDEPCIFTAELKFIAVVINGPGSVGLHVYATFDPGYHFRKTAVAGFEVDIGHAVDRCPVPAGCPKTGYARES